ncbi:hypothetical protein Moror_11465 [Moniliophthora roreri MCA 2997]|uniref:Uncharacterized protein n=1 Tax=Moniliophthora roreri (strain MCA 2997) TaxID=1381753 RepID=V2XXE7_MONRO|nr:hypothetical protein Moror_11465 [Moniliophthora roreri MCA 2997]
MASIHFIAPWRRPRIFLFYLTVFLLLALPSYEIYIRSQHTTQSLKWMKWNYEVIHDSQSHPDARILLVSAFFPSNVSQHEPPAELINLLALNTPIYLFVPPSLALGSATGHANLNTTFKDVSSLPLHIDPARGIEDAKPWLLKEGMKNSGGAGGWDYVFWIDADAFRQPFAGSRWPAPERINRIWEETGEKGGAAGESKVFVPAHGMFKKSDRYWKSSDGPVRDEISDAALFGGSPDAITWLARAFYAYREHYLEYSPNRVEGKAHDIVNTLFLLYPWRFIGVHTDDPHSPAWISPSSVLDDRWLRYMLNKYILKDLAAHRALGRCGDESAYYQFFLADKETRDKLAKGWLDAHDGFEDQIHVPGRPSVDEPEEDERCRLTNPILFEDVFRREDVFGADWQIPEVLVWSADKMSYMRSTSFSPVRVSSPPAQMTPRFSNQHCPSTFRQDLDGIDELDEEQEVEQQPEELPPVSSSPSTALIEPHIYDSSPDYLDFTKIDACHDPFRPKHEGHLNADYSFFEDLHERLTRAAEGDMIRDTGLPFTDIQVADPSIPKRNLKKRARATSSTQLTSTAHDSSGGKRVKTSGHIDTLESARKTSSLLDETEPTLLTIDEICGLPPRQGFASTTATARRALSLRSADGEKGNEEKEKESLKDWVPTVPSSPALPISIAPSRLITRKLQGEDNAKFSEKTQTFYADLDMDQGTDTDAGTDDEAEVHIPIIAPPPDHVAASPLSGQAQAKLRLVRLMERESEMRKVDDLENSIGLDIEWKSFGVPQQLGEEIVKWILEVLPRNQYSNDRSSTESSSTMSSRSSSVSSRSDSLSPSEYHLYTPSPSPPRFKSSPTSSSQNSYYVSSPRNWKMSQEKGFDNLINQLKYSPETRWMGIFYLMRFFWCLTCKGYDDYDRGKTQESIVSKLAVKEEHFTSMMWDIAVGCLALSVKMRRDFLPPLFPVYSCVFEELAPPCRGFGGVSYGELESAQRLILFGLNYNLGSSPQAVLDELWISVPAFQEVISQAEWARVQVETWKILLKAVKSPNVLVWTVSELTGVACVMGVEETLVKRWEAEMSWMDVFERERATALDQQGLVEDDDEGVSASSNAIAIKHAKETRKGRIERASLECRGLDEDVKAVLSISNVMYRRCRKWLKSYRKSL